MKDIIEEVPGHVAEHILDLRQQISDLKHERDLAVSTLSMEIADLKERVAVLAGEAVRVAASEPEPKHHKFRLVETKEKK